MRRTAVIIAFTVFMSTFVAIIAILPEARAATLYVGGGGPGNYTTIQGAIDAAFPGDVIFIYNGTYFENIQVYKSLSLVGETRDNTTIDGSGIEDAVHISADWVNITGFTITGGTGSSGIRSGIEFDSVENSTASGNNVTDNDYGITIDSSTNIVIVGNIMFENGISIWGDSVEQWSTHVIDTTNTVNRKPVYYWKNVNGGTIPHGAGQVILANCTDVTVQDQDLSNGTEGLGLSFSSYNTIVNNTASYNERYGIFLQSSHHNTVSNNRLSHNAAGLYLWHSDYNVIAHNLNISYGLWGIYIADSSFNQIYHNNFVENDHQANDITGMNEWNLAYPSGGNYWSDFTDIDEKSGPLQDQPGSDGIWDSPYVLLSGASKDHYPLTAPIGPTSPSAPSEPRKLEATAGNRTVVLTWMPPMSDGGSIISSYIIYRGLATDSLTFLGEIGNVLTYTDTGLVSGQTYHYTVSAKNSVGEGPQSDEANATPSAQNVPPTCSIRSPTPGARVGGDHMVWGMANDTDGTAEIVEIRIDEGPWLEANWSEVDGTRFWIF
ncbi:MAG: hypothetical protein E3J35_09215, partial [Methanomassiliicoccales archaeon]